MMDIDSATAIARVFATGDGRTLLEYMEGLRLEHRDRLENMQSGSELYVQQGRCRMLTEFLDEVEHVEETLDNFREAERQEE